MEKQRTYMIHTNMLNLKYVHQVQYLLKAGYENEVAMWLHNKSLQIFNITYNVYYTQPDWSALRYIISL